jgi:hypothetical protein
MGNRPCRGLVPMERPVRKGWCIANGATVQSIVQYGIRRLLMSEDAVMRRLAVCGFRAGVSSILMLSATFAVSGGPAPPVVAPQPTGDAAILQAIFADWSARRERFTTVRHTLQGETTVSQGAMNDIKEAIFPSDEIPAGDIPFKDINYPTATTCMIDFERGFVRIEHRASQFRLPATLVPTYDVRMFAGEWKQCYRPRAENPERRENVLAPELTNGKEMPVYSDGFFDASLRPLLYAHGFVPGSSDPRRLSEPADYSRLYGVGQAEHEGRTCAVLRLRPLEETELVQEFWVDVERDSAVVRFSRSRDSLDGPVTTVSYRETPAGWMPERWTIESIGGRRETVRLVTTERNPDLSGVTFAMKPTVGMIFKQGEKLWIHRGEGQKPLNAREHIKTLKRQDL